MTDEHAEDAGTNEETTPELRAVSEPAAGLPDVVASAEALEASVSAVAGGTGPVALDAERASGYRYSQRAYLVQVFRRDGGLHLIDPIACPDLTGLDAAIGDSEWILHAATQDLVCLAEVGLRPRALFDTELGGRLAGRPRVGLGAMVEHYLHISLAKEHSAVDWSTRPLPEPWLRYAALDVDILVDLRDAVAADLEEQGKAEFARQEFEHLLSFSGPADREDPWRRANGMHRVRSPRGLAVAREVWQTRDELAADEDVTPSKILPDAGIIELALAAVPPKKNPNQSQQPPRMDPKAKATEARVRRALGKRPQVWQDAITRALLIPEGDLPERTPSTPGPPPARAWADRDPVAAERLAAARAALGEHAEQLRMPVENLLQPEALRRALWGAPKKLGEERLVESLRESNAREWQIEQSVPVILKAIG